MFKPFNFDASKKYPIVKHIYPGRRPAASAGALTRLAETARRLREPGFIPDQVTGVKHLPCDTREIDLDPAGIYGHSGGGYATAGAMFHYPDFLKVGISEAGTHDNREYEVLAHGAMDNNVPPYNTKLVVNEIDPGEPPSGYELKPQPPGRGRGGITPPL